MQQVSPARVIGELLTASGQERLEAGDEGGVQLGGVDRPHDSPLAAKLEGPVPDALEEHLERRGHRGEVTAPLALSLIHI